MSTEYLNLAAIEAAAHRSLDPMARDYYAGGARDELTLSANQRAWRELCLHYRVLVDVSQRTTDTTVLGQPISLPIIAAPTAFQRLAHPEGELAMARGVGAADTLMILSTLSTTTLEDVSAAAGGPLWFQLYVYRDRAVTRSLVQRAEAAGFQALVLTVDAAEIGTRERDTGNRFHLPAGLTVANLAGDPRAAMPEDADGSALSKYVRDQLDPSLSWADVEWLAAQSSLPVIIKGLVRADDARRAVDHGAQAVVVSNHGGRQLDTSPATATVLPTVADAVGDAVEVYVDGGIRRGTDVIKALALGARAVLVGRPLLYGIALEGAAGATMVIDLLRAELLEGMALCGCPDLASIRRDLVHPEGREKH